MCTLHAELLPAADEEVFQILEVLREQEERLCVPASLSTQLSITVEMRAKLCVWMYDLRNRFSLSCETYFLAVNYLDRILSGPITITRSKLQLVGATSLFIASKYEDVHPPYASQVIGRCDGLCDVKELFLMERKILSQLDWEMSVPTSPTFLDLFIVLLDLEAVSFLTSLLRKTIYLLLSTLRKPSHEFVLWRYNYWYWRLKRRRTVFSLKTNLFAFLLLSIPPHHVVRPPK